MASFLGNISGRLVKNKTLLAQLKELQKNPRSLVFLNLADSYRQEGLLEQALEILDEGLEFHPDLPRALILRAQCLLDLKKFGDALVIVNLVLKTNSENIRAWKLKAAIFIQLGQRSSAITAYKKVLNLFPNDKESSIALHQLMTLYNSGNSSGIESLRKEVAPLVSDSSGDLSGFREEKVENSWGRLEKIPRFQEVTEQHPPLIASRDDFLQAPVSDEVAAEELEENEIEPAFATKTIAELYLRQGLKIKAGKVLRLLLAQDPHNKWAKETLQVLESNGIVLAPTNKPENRENALKNRAKALKRLLLIIRSRRDHSLPI